jgi:putative PIN family toxin of toxin-antitoxin system
MIRIVIDANVLISAAFGGTPLDAVSKAFSTGEVLLSPDVIKEIDGTIHRLSPKLGEEKTEFLLGLWRKLASRCTTVEPVGKSRICRDPKDDAYLHLCIAAEADFLITGDKDLLVVNPERVAALPDRLRIVTPRRFLEPEEGGVDLAGIREKTKRLGATGDDVETAVRRARRRK